MKIKSIAAICKKNKNIAIFERYSDDGDILTQYIGLSLIHISEPTRRS